MQGPGVYEPTVGEQEKASLWGVGPGMMGSPRRLWDPQVLGPQIMAWLMGIGQPYAQHP